MANDHRKVINNSFMTIMSQALAEGVPLWLAVQVDQDDVKGDVLLAQRKLDPLAVGAPAIVSPCIVVSAMTQSSRSR